MKKIDPIAFTDMTKLKPGEMNAIHFETGMHSDVSKPSEA